eukprot:s528_g26.t2
MANHPECLPAVDNSYICDTMAQHDIPGCAILQIAVWLTWLRRSAWFHTTKWCGFSFTVAGAHKLKKTAWSSWYKAPALGSSKLGGHSMRGVAPTLIHLDILFFWKDTLYLRVQCFLQLAAGRNGFDSIKTLLHDIAAGSLEKRLSQMLLFQPPAYQEHATTIGHKGFGQVT